MKGNDYKAFAVLLLFGFLQTISLQAQGGKETVKNLSSKKDSLLKIIRQQKSDTTLCKALNALAWELQNTSADSAILLAGKALLLSENLDYTKGKAKAFHELAWFHHKKGNFKEAADFTLKSIGSWNELLASAKTEGERNYILSNSSKTYGNGGIIFYLAGNTSKATEFYFKALNIGERLKDTDRVLIQLTNIGVIFEEHKEYDKALVYYRKGLQLSEVRKDKKSIAISLGNIGVIYSDKGDTAAALKTFFQCLNLAREVEDKEGESRYLANIGLIYSNYGSFDKALHFYDRALSIAHERKDLRRIAINTGNTGFVYLSLKKYLLAEKNFVSAISLSRKIGIKSMAAKFEKALSSLYAETGEHQKALEHYKRHIVLSDSLLNEENTKKLVQQQMQYEFDKRSAADSIKNTESKKLEQIKHDKEIANQKTMTYAGIGGFLVMIVIAGISYTAFRNKKKANIEIEKQKLLVEVKQKEILDSIYYARRIQNALITSEYYFSKNLERLNGRKRS
jgi:tetratricopeptide (TPR) repeat protein